MVHFGVMSEESIDLLVTPVKNEFDSRNMDKNSAGNPGSPSVAPVKKDFDRKNMGRKSAGNPGSLNNKRNTRANNRRASFGIYQTGVNSRRYSSERTGSANIGGRVVPRYLRAPTGTCHDICKYGRRRAFEEPTRKPWKRTPKSSPVELKIVDMMIVSGDQNNEEIVKHKPSADTKKRSLLVKPSLDIKSYTPKLRASLVAKASSVRQNASSSNKTRLSNSLTKSTSSGLPEIIKREVLSPSRKVEVPMKEDNSIVNRMSGTDKKTCDQSVKRCSSVKPSSASDNPDGIQGKGRRNCDVKTIRKMTVSIMSKKKALVSPAVPLFPKVSLSKMASSKARKAGRLRLMAPLKDRKRMHRVDTETSNDGDSEKTLHVIKIETEKSALESIPHDHVVPALPSHSSPDSLSDVKSPSLLSHEEDDEDMKYNGNDEDEFVSDKTVSVEIGNVRFVKENHVKKLRMGIENNALEFFPDDHAIPALRSPSSSTSLSHVKSRSLLSHEEDDEKIKYSGNDTDDFVSNNTISMEIDKVEPVEENHDKIDDHAIPALSPSPSSHKSLCHARSPSLLSHEEDDEEINHSDNDTHDFGSDNTISMEIDKVQQSVEENHDKIDDHAIPPLSPSPSSRKSLCHAKSPSLLSHEEDDEEINHSAGIFVSDNSISMEIDKVQPVEENHDKIDDHAIPPLSPSPSSHKSLSHAKSPSLLSHEEDDEANEFASDNPVLKQIAKGQSMKQNQNKTLRKSRAVFSEDKHRSPVKLKFRIGKVLDIQPSDNNFPRKLIFRRSSFTYNRANDSASDNKKSMVVCNIQHTKENYRRILRKTRVIDYEDKYRSPVKLFRNEKPTNLQPDSYIPRRLRFRRAIDTAAKHGKGDSKGRTDESKDDAAGSVLSPGKVILKHQDVEGKKNARGLFNNVIEETASKLVESRKGKVKALVGAFETVISLQERKPAKRNVT